MTSNETYKGPSPVKDTSGRKCLYKKPIRRDNLRLETEHEETPQEIRRKRLLHHQKECRDAAFNAARAMLDDVFLSEEEEENCEPMEVERTRQSSKRNRQYANKLMMSEWMVDVPEDFVTKWSMVPCPKGRRNLIVAYKGRTEAYSRRGDRLASFNSALPGGNYEELNRNCTLLDCIWIARTKSYYVLDVLAWANQPLLDCDAEFRRFWLKSKLEENPDLKLSESRINQYPILPLPSVSCDNDLSEFLENLSPFPALDGLLFYHRDGYYMHGFTPLVTWLKPYMLPEVLGVSVPPPLDEKPVGYLDFRHHIRAGKEKRKELSPSSEMETSTDE